MCPFHLILEGVTSGCPLPGVPFQALRHADCLFSNTRQQATLEGDGRRFREINGRSEARSLNAQSEPRTAANTAAWRFREQGEVQSGYVPGNPNLTISRDAC